MSRLSPQLQPLTPPLHLVLARTNNESKRETLTGRRRRRRRPVVQTKWSGGRREQSFHTGQYEQPDYNDAALGGTPSPQVVSHGG